MSEEIKQSIATAVANRKLLWYYTPSQNSAEELEGIFVQRESIAKDAVERIKEGALKDAKHHLLFVGPRGCGKTHLVSLIYHRLMAMKRVSSKLRVAWLNEDEMSPSFLDLLVRIYRALSSAYKDQFEESAMEPVYDLDIEDAEVFLRDLIIEKLGKQSLLVIVENLDELMKGLKTKGQMKWRAFIQDTKKCATLATAQKMVPAVKDRKAPFYGTFQVENLEMLSVKEAVDLLKKVAVFYKDAELLEYLNTEPGRQRVECLHILTGGNHRVMIVLAQFVTRDSLEELIELFFKMLNELTPYYQERLRWISAQQRKIITFLCSSRPIRVNAMAKKLFITEQTLSSQLRDLLKMGYVKRDILGRESIYQVAEPLMRMCIEVKENNQREPIKLIIEFLKIWCNRDTLMKQLQICEQLQGKIYIQKAVDTFEESEFFGLLKSSDDFSSYKSKQELKNALDCLNTPELKDSLARAFLDLVRGKEGTPDAFRVKLPSDVLDAMHYLKEEPLYYSKVLLLLTSKYIFNRDFNKVSEVLDMVTEFGDSEDKVRANYMQSISEFLSCEYQSSLNCIIVAAQSDKLTNIEKYCLWQISKKIIIQNRSWGMMLKAGGKVDMPEAVLFSVILTLILVDCSKNKISETDAIELLVEGITMFPDTVFQVSSVMGICNMFKIGLIDSLNEGVKNKVCDALRQLEVVQKTTFLKMIVEWIETKTTDENKIKQLNVEESSMYKLFCKNIDNYTALKITENKE